jgi:hypothetical protein
LVQAFLKKWWVESDFKAPNLPLSLRLKVSGCHYNSIYNNIWTKQVKQLSKQHQIQWNKCQRHIFTSHIDKKIFSHFCWLPYLYTFSLYENPSFIIFSAETEYISTRSWYRNINFLRDRIRRIFLIAIFLSQDTVSKTIYWIYRLCVENQIIQCWSILILTIIHLNIFSMIGLEKNYQNDFYRKK